MKSLIVLFLLGITLSLGSAIPSLLKYKEGNRFFLFPDGDDRLHLIDLEEKRIEPRFDAEADTVLNLYTRKNPTNPNVLVYGNVNSITSSTFDVSKPVKIIAHGWNSDSDSKINTAVTAAFLNVLDVNVIFVDWSKGGGGLYTSAVGNVPKVGAFLGAVVDWLVVNGVPIENFHIMGHSLGGHVVGIAARNVFSGRLPYITAFDPAFPLWGEGSERIRASDGEYVEVIHTNAGELGLKVAVGHNDFYPNEGTFQPGCLIDIACSHSRSYLYFAYSLDHTGFMADQCNTVDEATDNKCANIGRLHMGGSQPKPAMGIFHLKTSSDEPYYLG